MTLRDILWALGAVVTAYWPLFLCLAALLYVAGVFGYVTAILKMSKAQRKGER